MNHGLHRKLVEFTNNLRLDSIPPEVVHAMKLHLFDSLGICFVTQSLPFARAVSDVAQNNSASGKCTIVGKPGLFSAPAAALVNGTLCHGAELDDCHAASITHPGSSLVPVVLAVGEEQQAPGARVLEAVIAAYEILIRLAFAAPGKFHSRGLQTTSMCAPLANALSAGKLMGLDPGKMAHAAGLAAALAGGLRTGNDDGSWTKRLFSGWTGQTGIISAQLAAQGFTGPFEILESRFGLYEAHLGEDSWDPEEVTKGLNENWEGPRTSFRIFPCSHGLHSTIECCLKVRSENGFKLENVERVECRLPENAARWWFMPEDEKRRPPSTYAAMFSIPYVAAVSLVRGEVNVSSFDDTNLSDSQILAMVDKMEWSVDNETPFPKTFPGWVVAHMKDGSKFEARQVNEPGSVKNPISEDELFQKFDRNTKSFLSPEKSEQLREKLMDIENAPDIRDILSHCRPQGGK